MGTISEELEKKYGIDKMEKPNYDSLESYKASQAANREAAGISPEPVQQPIVPTVKTATDTQKIKEDKLEANSGTESGEEKKDPKSAAELLKESEAAREKAQKDYDEYVKSDEHKKRLEEAANKAQIDRMAQATFNPNFDMMKPQLIEDEKEAQLRAAKEQAELDYNKYLDEQVAAADMAAITDLSDEERSQLEQYAVNRIRDQNQTLELQGRAPTAQQEAAALLQKYGQKRVDELAETLMRQQNAELAQTVDAKSREFANEHGILGSAATIPVAAVSGLIGTVGQLQGAARNTGRYQTLDANETGTIGDAFTGAVRGQVQENIEQGLGGGLLGKAASIGYQGLMSAADSIARAYLGGGAIGGAGLAATNSFSQTMADASRNGATPQQAVILATVNSAIEAASEKIPLDNLIQTAKGQGAATVLKNVLRQAGIEAATEEISLVGTVLAELAVMQEKSTYKQEVRDYILNGDSPEVARAKANSTILKEALNTALVSGVAGGLSGAGASKAQDIEAVADRLLGDLGKPKQQEQQPVMEQQTQQPAEQQSAPAQETTEAAAQEPVMETPPAMQEQRQVPPSVPAQQQRPAQPMVENREQTYQQPEPVARPQEAPAAAPKVPQQETRQEAPQETWEEKRRRYDKDKSTMPRSLRKALESYQKSYFMPDPKLEKKALSDPTVVAWLQERGLDPSGTLETWDNLDMGTYTIPGQAQQKAAPKVSTQQTDTYTPVQMGASNVRGESVEGGQIKGVGAAERNFSGAAAYEDMLEEGNTQKERPWAVRDVEMPRTDPDGRRVTEFASNAVSAKVTPDPMADAIKRLVGDKQLSFDTRTNQQSLENAATDITARGADTIRTEISKNAENGIVKDGDIEKGLVLYAEFANDPNRQDEAAGLLVDMAKLANMSGRNLQLFSLMKRMTPEGQLMTVKKNVNRYIEDINKNRSKRKQIQNGDTLVDEDLTKAFTDAKTDKEKQAALDEIYKDVATKIKPTIGEMYDAWRNLAMLGNVKTHERNIFSTAAFQPYVEVKRAIGAALEKAAGIDQEKRTKAGLIGKEAKALLEWTKQDAKTDAVMDLMGFSGTTGNEARSKIQEHRQIMPGVLDKAAKKNMEIMEKSDMFFKKNEYARALASFLKARGYTAGDLQNGTVPKGVLDEGRQIAVKEAQKATFNDSNKFSDAIVKLGKPNTRDGWAVVNVVKKGMLPFLRTPANVVVRASEYNLLNGVKTLFTAKKDIESGRRSTADVLDQISASLTGTAATAIGMLLGAGAIPGIELIGAIEDEDELREGAQEYSLKIGDNYYGVGWLAPAMIPLFLGANAVRNGILKADENADAWDYAQAFVDLGLDTVEPILDLSMLSSLNDTIDKFANEEDPGDKAMAVLLNTATSYLQQGIPTLFGQLEQATEKEKSSTYVNTDNKLEKAIKTTIAGATKRVPGVDLYQTKKLDEFGRPVKNEGDALTRAIDALFNPFSKSKVKDDALTREITRLNNSDKDLNATPDRADKVVSYTDTSGKTHADVRLTEEQYQKKAQTEGDTAKRILDEVIQSDVYKSMTDEQKAAVFDTVYDYASRVGLNAAVDDYDGFDNWMKDLNQENEVSAILNKAVSSELSAAMEDLADDLRRGNDTAQTMEAMEQAYSNYNALSQDEKRSFMADASGRVKYYVQARNMGVSTETFSDLYRQYRNIENMDRDTTAKAQQWAYQLEKAVDKGIITEQQKENLKKNMQFRYSFAVETEKFDQMVETGVSTDNANRIIHLLDGITGTGSNGSVTDSDKRSAIASMTGVSDKEKDAIMKAYMPDYNPNASSPNTTELKYDYARKELGMTPQEYAEAYAVEADGGKKAQKIAEWESMGYSREEADMLYRLFSATGKTKINVVDWYSSIMN